jgi:hypothetical protein
MEFHFAPGDCFFATVLILGLAVIAAFVYLMKSALDKDYQD